ncbi:hypothetical protein Tco_1525250 [Tanacetum coccineum]
MSSSWICSLIIEWFRVELLNPLLDRLNRREGGFKNHESCFESVMGKALIEFLWAKTLDLIGGRPFIGGVFGEVGGVIVNPTPPQEWCWDLRVDEVEEMPKNLNDPLGLLEFRLLPPSIGEDVMIGREWETSVDIVGVREVMVFFPSWHDLETLFQKEGSSLDPQYKGHQNACGKENNMLNKSSEKHFHTIEHVARQNNGMVPLFPGELMASH